MCWRSAEVIVPAANVTLAAKSRFVHEAEWNSRRASRFEPE
jgi:hypothetical protein